MGDIDILPFICMSPHDDAPEHWQRPPAFAQAQRQRKKVEALFAELKNQIGLRRLRLRRMKFVREQFFLAAAAQNTRDTQPVDVPSPPWRSSVPGASRGDSIGGAILEDCGP